MGDICNLDYHLVFTFMLINPFFHTKWHAPKLLDRLKCEFEVKTAEEREVGDTFPGSQPFGGRGAC